MTFFAIDVYDQMDDYNAAADNYSNIPADDHDDYWEAIVHPKSLPRITLSHLSHPCPTPIPSTSQPCLNSIPTLSLPIPSISQLCPTHSKDSEFLKISHNSLNISSTKISFCDPWWDSLYLGLSVFWLCDIFEICQKT